MVFYLEKKNNDIYFGFFLSPLELFIKPREGGEESRERCCSNKLDHQNSLLFCCSFFKGTLCALTLLPKTLPLSRGVAESF
jgi:hypothetical protein